MSSFIVSDLIFKLMYFGLEFQTDLLEIRNLVVESILLISVSIFKFFQFFSVDLSEAVNFFKQMSDLTIFQNNLSIEDFVL